VLGNGWIVGAAAVGAIALHRGEPINALWLVVAATCCYALGYRFYSRFIAAKFLRWTGCALLRPSDWRTAATFSSPISGWFLDITSPRLPGRGRWWAGFGGAIWISSGDDVGAGGAVFAGCVQDFVILLFSVRRDGKSLTEMAKDEIGIVGGFVAYVAVIAILIILLGVAALIVVNALKASPWGRSLSR